MKVERFPINGPALITPTRFGDNRGWFSESWNAAKMADVGIDIDFVQDNHSFSAAKGTLRGLHFQAPPHAQDKLVRCSRGAVLDIGVDIRTGSPTYLDYITAELSADNGRQLFVPKGFAHGFLTLTDDVELQYKCSDFYAPECDRSIRWDDPDIAIDWGLTAPPILSEKDAAAPFMACSSSPFAWKENM